MTHSPGIFTLSPEFAARLNAQWYNPHLMSSSPEFASLLDAVANGLIADPTVYSRPPKDASGFVEALRVVLLNLLYVRFSDPSRYVAIPLGAAKYRKDEQGFGYKVFRRAFRAGCSSGLCEYHVGFRDRAKGTGRVTRIRAAAKLMGLAIEHQVRPSCIVAPFRKRLVELRAPKELIANGGGKRAIVLRHLKWPTDDTNQLALERMTTNLHRLNEHLGSCFIGLHVSDQMVQEINRELFVRHDGDQNWQRPEITWLDYYRKRLYRVFNDGSTERGGRFYGAWWEGIPKKYRKHIHLATPREIPGWTVELDFASIHPSILYALKGAKPPLDCYAIGERFYRGMNGRAYAKQAMLILLNATSRRTAERALQNEVRKEFDRDWYLRNGTEERRPAMRIAEMVPEGCPGIPEMLDLLAEYHKPIRGYFCTGIANELMYYDSQIAEKVMLTLLDRGVTSLPVHDSFIVRHEHEWALDAAMRQAFREVVGMEPQGIERSQTELGDFEDRNDGECCRLGPHDYLAELDAEGRTSDSIYWTHRRDWEATSRTRPEPDHDQCSIIEGENPQYANRTRRPTKGVCLGGPASACGCLSRPRRNPHY